ncbi:hypothetical protein, partial [Streptomyces europaeiscabiei]|uniref:hypothetical protein n=1 Tax=Streptomyces europaeiscabiei TaxID=146819 RepID=UPI0018FE96F3
MAAGPGAPSWIPPGSGGTWSGRRRQQSGHGGTIVAADAGLDSMVLSSPLPRTTSAVEDAFCPAVQNPDAGTRTPAHPTTVGEERVEAARWLPG